jgi:phospholipid transport system substrate-binding protein
MVINPLIRRHVLIMLLAIGAAAALPVVARAGTPEAYVKSLSDQAIAILTNSSLDPQARRDEFRMLILENAEVDRIADFALGRYAAQLRATDRYEEYVSLFREYIVRIYAGRLGGYSGERLAVTRSAPGKEANEVLVFSQILPGRSGGSPIAVNWRLRAVGGSYKVADVQVAGAWMSIEQRDQFTSIIANNNRQTTKIIDFLRQQLASTARVGSPT